MSNDTVFDMLLLSEEEITCRQEDAAHKDAIANWIFGGAILCVSAAVVLTPRWIPEAYPGIFEWVAKFVVWVVAMVAANEFIASRLGLDRGAHSWLPEDCCDTLATLCEQNPGLVPYRDRVRALARRFTLDEYWTMKVWARERRAAVQVLNREEQRRAACRRLYGVAE